MCLKRSVTVSFLRNYYDADYDRAFPSDSTKFSIEFLHSSMTAFKDDFNRINSCFTENRRICS